ncbi:MAG: hypothetical protein EBX53_05030 [Betaproteobacteria bacterium]|nr:hypothetical protein [Betaproteobacteria bacterium]
MDHRSRLLLKALVERYILDGQPVGSRTLSRHSGLDLSPATIRNVMADLEDMGLIASPHTSAGRVPTPRGYRLFVDSLLTVKPIEVEKTEAMQDCLQSADPQRVLSSAASLLSSLSTFAGVVMTTRRSARFRQVEFLRLNAQRFLLIIVTDQGERIDRDLSAGAQPRGHPENTHVGQKPVSVLTDQFHFQIGRFYGLVPLPQFLLGPGIPDEPFQILNILHQQKAVGLPPDPSPARG